jgi:hypothetical protein
MLRTRWAAIGAAVAVTLGAGGVSLGHAAIGTGAKPVFVAIEPCRLVDTRPGTTNIGGRTAPLSAGDTLTLQITGSTGQCTNIPAGATAAAMNVTAIQGSTRSFLTIYPADADLPNASNLNWNGGDPPTPNKVDVALSPGGAIKITNNAGTVHVAADLVGYYTDHHHDDRYYTKTQTDDVVQGIIDAQPWEIYISPNEMQRSGSTWPAVTFASGVDAIGMAYNDGEFGRAYYGFKLPGNYEAGTDVAVDMRYLAGVDQLEGDLAGRATHSRSRRSDASFRSLRPFWRSPMIVPSPRRSRSTSASSKPSVVRDQRLEAGARRRGWRPRPPGSRRGGSPAADPAAELVELGDAEAVGVEDHHDVALGTSTPTSMTVVATSTSSSPDRNRAITLLLGRRHRPCSSPSRRPGELAVRRALVGLLGRGDLELLGLLDQRAHHVGLAAGGDLGADLLPHLGSRSSPARGPTGCRSGCGPAAARRAPTRRGRRRRSSPRCAGSAWPSSPARRARARPLVAQRGPLLDAEAVLLVDDHHAERREVDAGLDERVGADDEVDLAGGQRPSARSRDARPPAPGW